MAMFHLKMNRCSVEALCEATYKNWENFCGSGSIIKNENWINITFNNGSIKIYKGGDVTVIGSTNASVRTLGRDTLSKFIKMMLLCKTINEKNLYYKIYNLINDCRLVETRLHAVTTSNEIQNGELFKYLNGLVNLLNDVDVLSVYNDLIVCAQETANLVNTTITSPIEEHIVMSETLDVPSEPYIKHHAGTVHLGIHAMLNSIIEDIQKSINTNGVFVYDDGIEKMTVRVIPGIEVTGTSIPDMINVTIDSDYPSKKQTNDFISMEKKVIVVDQLKQAIMRSAIRSLNTSEQFGTHANFFVDKK